jgi:hypothetical protein
MQVWTPVRTATSRLSLTKFEQTREYFAAETRSRATLETPMRMKTLPAALALLCATLWVPDAQGYPQYDSDTGPGIGTGCVNCHGGFTGGPGNALHNNHLNGLMITSCNLCHPAGGGTRPVSTNDSGYDDTVPNGGYGCAGCHGGDYGETNFGGEPKASGYGLRQHHANNGVTLCAGCHATTTILPESSPPPYYTMMVSRLTNPCDSTQEDMPFDVDSIGLDNDGDGLVDALDPDCAAVTTTTTTTSTTTTIPVVTCAGSPSGACINSLKGQLLVNEKSPGNEKLKVKLTKLASVTTQSNFGDPVGGSTSWAVCIYDQAGTLQGEMQVDRAQDLCCGKPCWKALYTKGYKFGDKLGSADGITLLQGSGGEAEKGKAQAKGQNKASKGQTALPTGIAAALQSSAQATVQIVTSDAACFSATVSDVKLADGLQFKANTAP